MMSDIVGDACTEVRTMIRKVNLFLSSILMLSMLAPAATITDAFAQGDWKQAWEKVLNAAHKEGVVVVSGPPGAFQRRAITEAWPKAFPKIKLEYTGGRGTQIVAKVVRERQAGLYKWDVILASTSPTVFSYAPINALAPLRDALINPELWDDKTWIDGFEAGFMDDAKKYFYNPLGVTGTALGYVNRDCLKTDAFNKAADMLKPEIKGKIVWYDPTRPGTSSRSTWVMTVANGEKWLEDIFKRQDVTFSRDFRQMTDWVVSCRKPIGIGMVNDNLEPMQKEGIGTNVEEIGGRAYFGDVNPGGAGGNESIGWYNNAPHPNAAKVFVNWYLSREFQQHYADIVKDNSRRVDTKPGDPNPNHVMKPNVKYLNQSNESATRKIHALQKTIESWGVLQKK
jgi:iron(III) transport system substrate-binding protein